MKSCIPYLSSGQIVCLNCGGTLDLVEYYTAEVMGAQTTRADYNTSCTTTTYRNVNHHIGGFCRHCAMKQVTGKRKCGMFLMIGGFVCFLNTMLFMVAMAASGGPGGGPELLFRA